MTTTPKQAGWKKPYLAPRVDRTQRKKVEGKIISHPAESGVGGGYPNYGPS